MYSDVSKKLKVSTEIRDSSVGEGGGEGTLLQVSLGSRVPVIVMRRSFKIGFQKCLSNTLQRL